MGNRLVWIPVVLWMAIIFWFSSEPYSNQDLRPWLKQNVPEAALKERLQHVRVNYNGSEISIQTKGVQGFLEFFIRKGAHIFVFAVLAFLVYWALTLTWRTEKYNFWIAFIVSLIYAMLDEWHQSFNPERTAKWADVGIDAVGIVFGLLFAVAIRKIWGMLK
ncbi:VanZ family protein [Ammoniphilus sp. CFH 90114]|uniref:VanZ family protein n=1 Tax=Ammoniphilus sp. CFH 90114 TaxID=2493665 RepID=UPI00101008C2|nr:VanZ family protein [Ammoniphilus sp. CFH 90114]RXT02870.1 VanZ family protein [Ammoniphilus sp. CFH 90114]